MADDPTYERLEQRINELEAESAKRKHTEEALRESEEFSSSLLTNSPNPMLVINADTSIRYVNPALEQLTGFFSAQIVGKKTPYLWWTGETLEKTGRDLKEAMLKGAQRLEELFQKKDGDRFWVEITSTPVRSSGELKYYLANWMDITERKRQEKENERLQAQLRQAEKMEAIGTLAGGIAHDFNNILGVIMGYTELVRNDLIEGTNAKANLERVLKAGHRAKDLVKQILTFSRQAAKELVPLQINLVVKEVLKLLRSSLPTTIEFREDIRASGKVLADPTEIHQIVMNLCTNAYHAMGEEGGVLGIKLSEVNLDPESAAQLPDLSPGPYMLLTVGDTGHGMDMAVMERIFEPYFTTKEKERGTGLGLSVVHGIVTSYRGSVTVDSEPGEGTTFHVYLPMLEDAKEIHEAEAEKRLPTGCERILLIDDDRALVDIGKQMLERLGYEVTCRTCSVEGLGLFRGKPDYFDLVICDMIMPQLPGDKLARELMRIRPDIPIILCTGFSERISEKKAAAMGICGFLMKPVVMKEMAETIRNVLDKA